MAWGRAVGLLVNARAAPGPGWDRASAAGLRRSWMHCLQAAGSGRMMEIGVIETGFDTG